MAKPDQTRADRLHAIWQRRAARAMDILARQTAKLARLEIAAALGGARHAA